MTECFATTWVIVNIVIRHIKYSLILWSDGPGDSCFCVTRSAEALVTSWSRTSTWIRWTTPRDHLAQCKADPNLALTRSTTQAARMWISALLSGQHPVMHTLPCSHQVQSFLQRVYCPEHSSMSVQLSACSVGDRDNIVVVHGRRRLRGTSF